MIRRILLFIILSLLLPISVWADPYPASSYSASFGTIYCNEATGSDNWPITWGDATNQYTAWGDGNGFDETTRVALGIGEIYGSVADCRDNTDNCANDQNWNIPDQASPNVKATGLLMVEGNLYLWTRRDDGSLRKSTNDGDTFGSVILTMEYGDELFYGLHFLQFDANYSNTLGDDYIYIYGTNHKAGDDTRHGVFLIRVDISGGASALEDEDNYEYYTGTQGGSASPTWSFDKTAATYVFYDENEATYARAAYNQDLQKVIFTVDNDSGTDGMGIFESDNPWGPWRTIYYTDNFSGDGTNTFEYGFPTKWHSNNGLTMQMVFSGVDDGYAYDSFCLQEVTLTPPHTHYVD